MGLFNSELIIELGLFNSEFVVFNSELAAKSVVLTSLFSLINSFLFN